MLPPLIQKVLEFNFSRQCGPVMVPMHVHHFCQMDVILRGSMILRLPDGGRRPLSPGAGTIIPPLSLHGFEITGSVHHATFKFHVHPRYAACLGRMPCVVRFSHQERQVATWAGDWSRLDDVLSVHGATAGATVCLVHALTQIPPSEGATAEGTSPPHEMWEVLNKVIASPHADWTVSRMAQHCHYSEGHFTKTFIRSFGQTPQRFLLEQRIWAAADRLNRGDESVKAVARATGYATVHSFTRAFKRTMGTTPAAYVTSQGKL